MQQPSIHRLRSRQSIRQLGISLVELMVAMTVGLFLTSGIIFLLLGSSHSQRSQDAMAVVQENARFLMEYLSQELRQAGSLGCQRALMLQERPTDSSEPLTSPQRIKNLLKLDDSNSICSTQTFNAGYSSEIFHWLFDYNNQPSIEGFDGTGSRFESSSQLQALIDAISSSNILNNAIRDQDVLIVRRASRRPIPVKTHDESDDPLIVFSPPPPHPFGNYLREDDLAIVSTCEYATIFQVDEVDDNVPGAEEDTVTISDSKTTQCPGNTQTDLIRRYANTPPSGTVPQAADAIGHAYRLSTKVFYLRRNTQNIPTLFVKENLSPAQQLVSGVYGMQVLYGSNSRAASCDTDVNAPDINAYVTAQNVVNWNAVNAVKISLVLGSPEENHANVVDNAMQFAFPGHDSGTFNAAVPGNYQTINSGDSRRLFQVFTLTVHLRNKLPCLGLDKWIVPEPPEEET